MWLKRHGDRCAANGFGLFNDFMEKGLVPDVYTVEIADGNNGMFKRFDNLIKMIKNFHINISLKSCTYFDDINYGLDMNPKIDICRPQPELNQSF